MAGREYLLFYDADCGLCTFFRNWVHRLDRGGRVRSIPLASLEANPFLGDLDADRRSASMHVVGPDGVRMSEGRGLLRLLEALPGLRGFSRLVQSSERGLVAAELVYTTTVLVRDGLAR
ncbi:MAG: DUF393 domain-containing protein [Methanobacteriota archaeon]|nr:MAG: DUF393 domain-containing protein [Euryarchaeota archaeon]